MFKTISFWVVISPLAALRSCSTCFSTHPRIIQVGLTESVWAADGRSNPCDIQSVRDRVFDHRPVVSALFFRFFLSCDGHPRDGVLMIRPNQSTVRKSSGPVRGLDRVAPVDITAPKHEYHSIDDTSRAGRSTSFPWPILLVSLLPILRQRAVLLDQSPNSHKRNQ